MRSRRRPSSLPASTDATAKHPTDEDLSAGTPLYRRITALLKGAGWRVGKDRVERVSTPASKLAGDPRIWRREGLKVPQKQKPRGRL